MKWFQHKTDASEDVKIKRLEAEYNNDGYAVFFKLLEKIGKEGCNFRLKLSKYPLKLLAQDFHLTEEKLKEILNKMEDISLIGKNTLKKGIISIPNMSRYADDYTDRVRRKSKQGSDNVPLDNTTLDKTILDKTKVNTDGLNKFKDLKVSMLEEKRMSDFK